MQGTTRPRFGTTAWPPGLLLPVSDFWPVDFAVRELLEVDTGDADAVEVFLRAWAWDPEANFTGFDATDPAEHQRVRWGQWCARAVLEMRRAAQEGTEPDYERIGPPVQLLLAAARHGRVDPDMVKQVEHNTAIGLPERPRPGESLPGAVDNLVNGFLEEYLRDWTQPRVSLSGDAGEHAHQPVWWAEQVAAQLFNYVSQESGWQRCANDPAHPDGRGQWFTVQRTDRRKAGGYGPQDASRKARFCSRQCARAHTERERRRRRREEGTQA